MSDNSMNGVKTTLLIPQSVDGNLRKGPTELMSLLYLDREEANRNKNAQAMSAELREYDVIYTSSRTLVAAGIKTWHPTGARKYQCIFIEDAEFMLDPEDIARLMVEYKHVVLGVWDTEERTHPGHGFIEDMRNAQDEDASASEEPSRLAGNNTEIHRRAETMGYNENVYNLTVCSLTDYPERGHLDVLSYILNAQTVVFIGFTSGYKGYLMNHAMVDFISVLLLPAIIGYSKAERAIVGLKAANSGDFQSYTRLKFEKLTQYPGNVICLTYEVGNTYDENAG